MRMRCEIDLLGRRHNHYERRTYRKGLLVASAPAMTVAQMPGIAWTFADVIPSEAALLFTSRPRHDEQPEPKGPARARHVHTPYENSKLCHDLDVIVKSLA